MQRAFLNISINKNVDILNSILFDILSSLIPHEYIVCDDKGPQCFNKKIRAIFQEKDVTFKKY